MSRPLCKSRGERMAKLLFFFLNTVCADVCEIKVGYRPTHTHAFFF